MTSEEFVDSILRCPPRTLGELLEKCGEYYNLTERQQTVLGGYVITGECRLSQLTEYVEKVKEIEGEVFR